jgi:DNA-binding response OmpR family regulator
MAVSTPILVIEDDAAIARALQDGLEREGYAVAWRAAGAQAVEYARVHPPRLFILDVRLPDGSGFDVCRQLGQLGFRQPILMLTVQRDEVDKVLGLEMGADDYLTKPYSLRELLARVRALMRRAYGDLAGAEAEVLHKSDLAIDRTSGQVWRGAHLLNLTPTEFRLLVYLAHNAGQVLSRAQILEAAWGYEAAVEDERTVTVHIRRLREKVEPDPSRPTLILTVPGFGYRLAR